MIFDNRINKAIFIDNKLGPGWICLASSKDEDGNMQIQIGLTNELHEGDVLKTLEKGMVFPLDQIDWLLEKHDGVR